MNKISLQIIEELTTYNDAAFKVLQGRLSLGMYGSDVSQEVAQHVADDSQRRKLNDTGATLPKVSPTWEVDLELERVRSLDLWCGSCDSNGIYEWEGYQFDINSGKCIGPVTN